VEINNTVSSLPEASTFDAWRRRAPEGVVDAPKMTRHVAHMKRWNAPRGPVEQCLSRVRRRWPEAA